MSQRSVSFWIPFGVSFAVSTAAGLAILYFAVYRPRIETGRMVIANAGAPATEAPSRSFETDESGVQRGSADQTPAARSRDGRSRNGTPTEKPAVEKTIQKPADAKSRKSDRNGSAAAKSTGGNNKNTGGSSDTATGSSRTDAPGSARKNGAKTGGSTEPSAASADRKPAFPSTQPQNDDAGTGSTTDPPSMDDPAMEENPLIRALKSASQKKKEGGDTQQETPASRNPFDFILNKDKQ